MAAHCHCKSTGCTGFLACPTCVVMVAFELLAAFVKFVTCGKRTSVISLRKRQKLDALKRKSVGKLGLLRALCLFGGIFRSKPSSLCIPVH